MARAMQRSRQKKLWLPSEATLAASEPAIKQEEGCDGQDSDDELDKLTAQFEQEAAQQKAAVVQAKGKGKPQANSMSERREEGLAIPLDSDNRGFQMLAAMGYQQGKGLGKDQSGRAAPIDVKLKSDRLGLGGEEAKKRKQQHLQQQQAEAAQKRMRNQEQQAGEFKQASVARAAHRRAEGLVCDARKVQRSRQQRLLQPAIEMLDHRQGLPKSHLWPPEPKQMPEDHQEAAEDIPKTAAEADQQAWEELPVQARLAEALDYLRQRYHYCLFCGCQYEDEADLDQNCPGLQAEDH